MVEWRLLLEEEDLAEELVASTNPAAAGGGPGRPPGRRPYANSFLVRPFPPGPGAGPEVRAGSEQDLTTGQILSVRPMAATSAAQI